jgi:hypothetical protein
VRAILGPRKPRDAAAQSKVTLHVKRCLPALISIALLLGSAPQPATAQGFPFARPRDVLRACGPDYMRLCRDVPPGGGRVILCMQLNADKLSPPCFQAMTAWGLVAANAFKACQPDAQRFCGQVPPGGGRGLSCLLQNADRLSRPCRDALSSQDLLDDEPPGPRNGGR